MKTIHERFYVMLWTAQVEYRRTIDCTSKDQAASRAKSASVKPGIVAEVYSSVEDGPIETWARETGFRYSGAAFEYADLRVWK